ncbi:MAG TPA: hypothetical protein VF695_03520 [Sphingomonas sp.]|jgi:hypothetical protein
MITPAQRVTAFRFLLALALTFAVTMAILPDPPHLPTTGWGDKINHMLAFALLALLAANAYPAEPLWRIGERLSFLGALIEVIQSIPGLHRDCDILDWIADTFAVSVLLLLVAAVRAGRRSRTV